MLDEKNLTNDEIDEETEAVDVLSEMVHTLNELPTEVLQQLLDNLNEIEEYNKAHPEIDLDNYDE